MDFFAVGKIRSVLNDRHVALNARMIDFHEWLMPVYYKNITHEHQHVRDRVGIFDISHMGRILVSGPDAEAFLDYLSTNNIIGRADFSATYTILSSIYAGCIDDVIIYREDKTHFFLVVNASNRKKVLKHLVKEGKAFQVTIQDRYEEEGMLSIQGPLARRLIVDFNPNFAAVADLKPMQFCIVQFSGVPIVISRTGYTGAGGVEICAPKEQIIELWDQILAFGVKYDLLPIGLGARDTLRLEMGYALYGHEINENISASESVAAWAVKYENRNFIGREAMLEVDHGHTKRSEHGIIVIEPGIARSGYPILQNGMEIGSVTSGTQSPTLHQAIAIVLSEKILYPDEIVDVQVRNHFIKAKVVPLPFVERKL